MTPEIEATVNQIGWGKVKQAAPMYAASLALSFQDDAALVKTDAESRRAAKELNSLFKTTSDLHRLLRGLSGTLKRNINLSAIPPDEIEEFLRAGYSEPPDRVVDALVALQHLMIGLEATSARLGFEGGDSRRGNPRNLRPHVVARACARIYVAGTGEMPSANNDDSEVGIAGPFGRVVAEVFSLLGLGFDHIGPCREAVEEMHALPDEELGALLALSNESGDQHIDLELKNIF